MGDTAKIAVDKYNRQNDLIIDPLVYSTYLGSTGADIASAIALDDTGNIYITGSAGAGDFPTTPGVVDASWNGIADIFVTKMNPEGSGLVYSTYLGGAASEQAWGIAIDGSGNAYVAGETPSP